MIFFSEYNIPRYSLNTDDRLTTYNGKQPEANIRFVIGVGQ